MESPCFWAVSERAGKSLPAVSSGMAEKCRSILGIVIHKTYDYLSGKGGQRPAEPFKGPLVKGRRIGVRSGQHTGS